MYLDYFIIIYYNFIIFVFFIWMIWNIYIYTYTYILVVNWAYEETWS